ncbi:hypothetical protein AVEN_56106-1 [Araneus ventricosus]|uniref:Uncharacterized protein n=1 Tax=Araneus ventricosus TaxID=182803 RepID=A0A4Y2GRP3_ARAVE|nr:hypothetical protein AVEN_56106-1 [Araneus ventricosus]
MSGVDKFRVLPMDVRRSSKFRGSGCTYTLSFTKPHKKKTHGNCAETLNPYEFTIPHVSLTHSHWAEDLWKAGVALKIDFLPYHITGVPNIGSLE